MWPAPLRFQKLLRQQHGPHNGLVHVVKAILTEPPADQQLVATRNRFAGRFRPQFEADIWKTSVRLDSFIPSRRAVAPHPVKYVE
jgi:hypothetical protein